ncbi:MAG: hypothetical protein ACLFM0_10905 [Spirochaetales bacterium]
MKHPKLQDFLDTLKTLLDEVDDYLEERYRDRYTLHPARPPRGATANKASSGLFSIEASFSAGYGSEVGRGYVLEFRIVTLEDVPDEVEEEIDEAAAEKISELLPKYFPGRHLEISRDRQLFKLHGDLSLGSV